MYMYFAADEDVSNTDPEVTPWCRTCYGYHEMVGHDKIGCRRGEPGVKHVELTRTAYFRYPDEDWIR